MVLQRNHFAREASANRYLDRLALVFVMSRERQDIDAFNGRIDRAKVDQPAALLDRRAQRRRGVHLGPAEMTRDVQAALEEAGVYAGAHSDRRLRGGIFGARRRRSTLPVRTSLPTAGRAWR